MPVALYPGMRICSFTFEQLTTPSSVPYHKKASNKYAGQERPMASKLALRLNEHNNGYMAMGRYAVWTSDINRNDKPDLNEAFFIKRERAPDDPLRRSGRRFVGANVWPDETELPE